MLRALTGGLLASATSSDPGQPAVPATTDVSPPPPPWREHADAYLDLALPEESHAAALAALHDRGATGLMELVRRRATRPAALPSTATSRDPAVGSPASATAFWRSIHRACLVQVHAVHRSSQRCRCRRHPQARGTSAAPNPKGLWSSHPDASQPSAAGHSPVAALSPYGRTGRGSAGTGAGRGADVSGNVHPRSRHAAAGGGALRAAAGACEGCGAPGSVLRLPHGGLVRRSQRFGPRRLSPALWVLAPHSPALARCVA